MKESNFLADNVAKNLLIRIILKDTEEQFMKEPNFLVDNVTRISLRVIFQSTEEQFMKESNFLADNVEKNLPVKEMFQNTEG